MNVRPSIGKLFKSHISAESLVILLEWVEFLFETGDFQEVVPAVLPFHHIFGISAQILTSLLLGCKIVSIGKFSPEKYLEVIKNNGVST